MAASLALLRGSIEMDVRDLIVFETVARHGAMNRAAAALNTVQSNVTARIRALEDELSLRLFERTTRGVALTPAGRRLLPHACDMIRRLEDAKKAARDDGTPRGPLRIGSLESTAAVRLTPILTEYVAAYPEVDFILRTGTTAEMIDAVRDRDLDGAFVCGPVDDPTLAQEPLFREELVLMTGARFDSVDAAFGDPRLRILVLRAGCSYRQRLEDILARRGIAGTRVLEFGTIEAIIGCCAAGIGITLLPRSVTDRTHAGHAVATHPLPVSEGLVETVFVRPADMETGSALAAFLALAASRSTGISV